MSDGLALMKRVDIRRGMRMVEYAGAASVAHSLRHSMFNRKERTELALANKPEWRR